MDFERAAERLKKDHSKIQRRRPIATSAQAKLQAEQAKLQRQQLAAEREKKRRQEDYITEYYRQCERVLGVNQLSNVAPLMLDAVSIHGEGDKIALPPSILEYMTSVETTSQSPWVFRIGVLNPDYQFPASPALQNLLPPEEHDLHEMSDNDDEKEDADEELAHSIYLNELSKKYLAYTHGTVVEFTQEEGYVGLPESIATVLLKTAAVSKTRTVDPSTMNKAHCQEETTDEDMQMGEADDDDGPKTAGHLAWGAFDVPDLPLEITWIHNLPKGKACELTPTQDAIRAGFYSLQDIKMVLEQSLIRTRATLSVGDIVHSWHRGVKYDLQVTSVTPSKYNTIICINTDLEVEFGRLSDDENQEKQKSDASSENVQSMGQTLGYKLSSAASHAPVSASIIKAGASALLDEPPVTQTEHVCMVQIRAPNGATGKRRFDVRQATINDLIAFAETLGLENEQFQLVTRFPRRVFQITDGNTSLETAGLKSGQEVFLVEHLS